MKRLPDLKTPSDILSDLVSLREQYQDAIVWLDKMIAAGKGSDHTYIRVSPAGTHAIQARVHHALRDAALRKGSLKMALQRDGGPPVSDSELDDVIHNDPQIRTENRGWIKFVSVTGRLTNATPKPKEGP